jgi:hypothetical protein
MIGLSIKKKRKVKPVRESVGVGYRGIRNAVVRHFHDTNESVINLM